MPGNGATHEHQEETPKTSHDRRETQRVTKSLNRYKVILLNYAVSDKRPISEVFRVHSSLGAAQFFVACCRSAHANAGTGFAMFILQFLRNMGINFFSLAVKFHATSPTTSSLPQKYYTQLAAADAAVGILYV